MATRRYTIHVPYLVNRLRSSIDLPGGEKAEDRELTNTLNQMFSELHRYLRYLGDSNDENQRKIHNELDGRDAVGAHPGTAISFDPCPPLTSDNIQDAICELLGIVGIWTNVELDFGTPAGLKTLIFTVPDAAVTATSRVVMMYSATPAAGRDEDEAEFEAFSCRCVPDSGGGAFRAYITSLLGDVVGPYVFSYQVAA